MKKSVLAFTLFMAVASGAMAAEVPIQKSGDTLVDAQGMTLYTFDKDTAGKSACNDRCATNWPPVAADANAQATGKFSVITRDDGTKQWAYDGMPLYRYKSDTKPGDRSGDNLNNVWHAARE
jgi:predicted lipoprotein with Yx(FWY)xxD motif